MFLSKRSTSCSTRILAFAFIPFMEYDVVFPSIFVKSFTRVFKTGDSSFAAHCFAFGLDCSFRSRVCSSDSLLSSACMMKHCSSSASSEEEVVTSIGFCLNIVPDFETYLLRDFKFISGEKASCSVDWSSNVCYFKVKLQHIITCIPECWWDCLCLEKAGDWLVVCQDNCWLCCLPQNVFKLEKCQIDCQNFFWVYGHFKLCRGESFWHKCHGGIRFPLWLYSLIGIVFNP